MVQDEQNLERAATIAAARRLVGFLGRELRELPSGHPWRLGYTRELIRVKARYSEELSELA